MLRFLTEYRAVKSSFSNYTSFCSLHMIHSMIFDVPKFTDQNLIWFQSVEEHSASLSRHRPRWSWVDMGLKLLIADPFSRWHQDVCRILGRSSVDGKGFCDFAFMKNDENRVFWMINLCEWWLLNHSLHVTKHHAWFPHQRLFYQQTELLMHYLLLPPNNAMNTSDILIVFLVIPFPSLSIEVNFLSISSFSFSS